YLWCQCDTLEGAVEAPQVHIATIWHVGKNLGGSLSDFMVWMLERSMKTLALRVKAKCRNAKKLAKVLDKHPDVTRVYYPGLKSHPEHALAKSQMKRFGAMMSFELDGRLNASKFLKALTLIKPSMSLAGVESTMLLPALTSHSLLSKEERETL